MCVQMRVSKHGSDITQTFIGYVLSDARFDWPVGNMSVYQENSLDSCLHETVPYFKIEFCRDKMTNVIRE